MKPRHPCCSSVAILQHKCHVAARIGPIRRSQGQFTHPRAGIAGQKTDHTPAFGKAKSLKQRQTPNGQNDLMPPRDRRKFWKQVCILRVTRKIRDFESQSRFSKRVNRKNSSTISYFPILETSGFASNVDYQDKWSPKTITLPNLATI